MDVGLLVFTAVAYGTASFALGLSRRRLVLMQAGTKFGVPGLRLGSIAPTGGRP